MIDSKQMLPKFDYGSTENMKVYGQTTPPSYDVTKINNSNIILYTGLNDRLADPTDVDKITKLNIASIKNKYTYE